MLVDGKLQIWQFFAYRQEKHFPFYRATQFNDDIIPLLPFMELLDTKPSPEVFTLTQLQFSISILKCLAVAVSQSERHNLRVKFVPPKKHIILWEILQDEITNILNGLVEKNIFGRLQNEQTVLKRLEEFKKQFAAPTELDLVAAIQNYLRAEPARQLYRELEECAYDEGKVPSKSQMRYFSRDVVKRLMVRAGHRPQLYGEAFTRELFMKALADGPAKNPYHDS